MHVLGFKNALVYRKKEMKIVINKCIIAITWTNIIRKQRKESLVIKGFGRQC